VGIVCAFGICIGAACLMFNLTKWLPDLNDIEVA